MPPPDKHPDVDTYSKVMEVLSPQMKNPDYTILVIPHAFGQFRIQITDATKHDYYAPTGHGPIVREMCTYKQHTMVKTVSQLLLADDPTVMAESYAQPYNCDGPKGRIRLDNVPADRPVIPVAEEENKDTA